MTSPPCNALSIAAVERETGLSKDTLRVWERRYRFPRPGRDAYGERSYPPDQVEKLRLIRVLMDQGHRPGKIVGEDLDVLRRMAARGDNSVAAVPALPSRSGLEHYIALCKAHRQEELRHALSQALLRQGMYSFVVEVIAPLNAVIGAQWAGGAMAVFEEHLYTECVQAVLRSAVASMPARPAVSRQGARPRILLTTVPQEQHGLGLLMAEAIFALEGARCISLGTQTPISDIVRASAAHAADVVALSFSASFRPALLAQALADLRGGLPKQVEIWAGGHNAALHRKAPQAVRVMELQDIGAAVTDWRQRH
ncbi:MAG TPA: MerR family transcriptional regulator [Noviherbaspirillum sp.]|nr:MerR family transcriptional regulator [Noviherbaspirillum sp.]